MAVAAIKPIKCRGLGAEEAWKRANAQVDTQWNAVKDIRCVTLRTPEALMDIPLISTYLEEGLNELGYSCDDVERDRL